MSAPERIRAAADLWRAARRPLFLSGAGISADSGLPTFRGQEGLWKSFRPEELATAEAFDAHRDIVQEWYGWRRDLIRKSAANPAHHAAARLFRAYPEALYVTQNVDGLHRASGLDSILEMHGRIFDSVCTDCGTTTDVTDHEINICGACGSTALRPGVVWFGETIPHKVLHSILDYLNGCDLILVTGTSGEVYPAAGFAVEVRSHGGTVIEINTEIPRLHSPRDIFLSGRAAEVLPLLVDAILTPS